MPNFIRQIMYSSQSVRPMTSEDCKAILRAARANNERNGITGFLAYAPDGTFVQILEGESDVVEETYARISQDPRHYGITRLLDSHEEERLFADWSMGFRELEGHELEQLPGFVNLADKDALSDFGEGLVVIDALKSILSRTPLKSQ
jgi:acylphosphatase